MTIRLFAPLALGLALLCTDAGAQSMPDLKGTWTGTSNTIVSGLSPNYPATTPARPAGPNRLMDVKFTVKIEGQYGNRFWDTVTSPTSADPFIGVIMSDGKRLRMVQSRASGVVDGYLVGPDSMEISYTEQSGGTAVAATNLYARQK